MTEDLETKTEKESKKPRYGRLVGAFALSAITGAFCAAYGCNNPDPTINDAINGANAGVAFPVYVIMLAYLTVKFGNWADRSDKKQSD